MLNNNRFSALHDDAGRDTESSFYDGEAERSARSNARRKPDIWQETDTQLIRVHTKARHTRFSPVGGDGVTAAQAQEWLADQRDTMHRFVDEGGDAPFRHLSDSWRDPDDERASIEEGRMWTGSTIFYKRPEKHGQRMLGPVVRASEPADHDPAARNTAAAIATGIVLSQTPAEASQRLIQKVAPTTNFHTPTTEAAPDARRDVAIMQGKREARMRRRLPHVDFSEESTSASDSGSSLYSSVTSSPAAQTTAVEATFNEQLVKKASQILLTERSGDKPYDGKVGVDSCSSHNPMPESVWKKVRKTNPGGERTLRQPVSFGTVANEPNAPRAPTATFEILLFFIINKSAEIFQQWFQVISGGTIALFPLLLGTPFMAGYGCALSYKTLPPRLIIDDLQFGCCDLPIAMVEIEFVSSDFALGRGNQLHIASAFFTADGEPTVLSTLAAKSARREGPPAGRGRIFCREPMAVGAIFLNSGSENLNDYELELEGGEFVVGSQDGAANDDGGEEEWEDNTEIRRRKLLRQFLENEHRALGHQKTAELLYEGEALDMLRAIRAECKLCGEFDDAKQVLYRGSLLQFADGRNITWLIDGMPSRIGYLVKIIDVCTRKRHTELVDEAPWKGGKTGAAIRCFSNARRALNGAPENLVFDLGSDFLSRRFQRVVTAANTKGRPVGLKAAYKISKLERTNGDDRLVLNKLTNLPADQWMEIFLWGLAGHYEDQDAYEGGGWEETLERLLKIRADQDNYPSEFELKQQIVAEMTWQQNQKPILGTQLSAENFHTGTFNRGTRDWELQLGELMNDQRVHDKDIEVFMERNAIVEADLRKVVVGRDLEMTGRRRELVGRVFYRGAAASSYRIGMHVAAHTFATFSSATLREDEKEVAIALEGEEKLFTDGVLHERVRAEVEKYRTSVNLAVESGKVYLSSAIEVPSPIAERSFDFDVLPKVTAFMEREKCREHTSRLQRGNNDMCFVFSQLLNGCCIRDKLSPKNPGEKREVHYVAVEVNLFKDRVRGMTPKGRHCYLRWGPSSTPEFCSEDAAREDVPGTFVGRVFFETCEDALEAVRLYSEGVKSSLIVVRLEDAVRLGFAMFAYAACVIEIQAIAKNGVLGERCKLKDIAGENIVSSRWLLAIKVERVSGRFTKAKARWITHGFKDVRYHRANGEAPDSRCYTVGDATILCMLHFNQSIRSHTDLADIAEAFLKGKKFSQLYEREADKKVYMKVPADILDLHVPDVEPLDEAIRLNKELYGQKGAPRGWECSWWDANRLTGLRQSFLDPSLWIYHHNQQERKALAGGYERQYFTYKLSQILSVPASNLQKRVSILELHSEPEPLALQQPREGRGMLNPMSIELHNQMLPHCQRSEPPAGMLGTHVDDTLSGGKLLFYLRLICLYEHFGLGSFTRLQGGQRDNFVGRELQMVPYAIDQWRVKQYLLHESDMMELSGITLDESAVEDFTEEELQDVEARTGVTRDRDPTHYAEATARTFDPWMFLDDQVEEPVVIYVSQQSYASKLTTVSDEEVNTYFRRRVGANKWAKKNGDIKSPIRGKLGELIWLEKTNACIVERLGDLASDAHFAEMASSADEIDLFLDELNNLVLLSQLPNMNVIRVYKIAELGEHFLGGGADASKDKVGGSSFLAGEKCRRLGTISRFGGGKPGRVFHSSTGIETLAQKLLVSENIFLAQITLDMFLCRLSRPLLSITDAKNLLAEPKERNLRPDYHSIAMLVRERLLVIAHGPGDRFWADGLTKEARSGHLFLLHLCINFGLVDKIFYDLVQAHIRRVLSIEDEARLAQALDQEVENMIMNPTEQDDDAGTGGMVLATQPLEQDYWTEGAGALTRWHVDPRVAKITPTRGGAVTMQLAEQWLTDDRVTKYTFLDGEKESGGVNKSD
eukprot:g15544.t1